MEQETKTTPAVETWVDIEGYEGIYQVSDLGQVRSLDQQVPYTSKWGTIAYRPTKGKVLTQRRLHGGYMGVLFKVKGKSSMVLVHRLVAKAFVPNPDGLETVNHKNENKQDNRAVNLEWMTRSDNVQYGTGIERRRKQTTEVAQMDMDGNIIATFPSILAASAETGVTKSGISKCIRGVYGSVTAGGYKWASIHPIQHRKKKDK